MYEECVNILRITGGRAAIDVFVKMTAEKSATYTGSAADQLDAHLQETQDISILGKPVVKNIGEETQAIFWFTTEKAAPDKTYRNIAKYWPELSIRAWGEAPACNYYYHAENLRDQWISEDLPFDKTVLSLSNRKQAWFKVLVQNKITQQVNWDTLLTDPSVRYNNFALPGDPVELDIILPRGLQYEDLIREHSIK